MIRLFAISVLAMTILAVPARAQSSTPNERWVPCLDSHPNIVIAGCTMLIETHVDSFADLGLAFYYRGNAYYSKGDYDQAIKNYDEAVFRRPENASAFNNRGNAYASKGDYDHAIADFTKATQLKPTYGIGLYEPKPFDYALVFNNRGIAYTNKHDYDRAIVDFSEAIHLNSAYAEAFDNRGNAYSNKHDYAHAIEDFSASLRVNPRDAYALYGRAVAKQETNDIAGARIDLTAAKQIDPASMAKFVKLLASDSTELAQLQMPSQPIAPASHADTPVCEIPPDSARHSQSNPATSMPSYMDDPIEQLKREVPTLAGIQFEPPHNTTNDYSDRPDPSVSILSRTGTGIAAEFQKLPNLIAKEKVEQPTNSSPDPDMTELLRSALTVGLVTQKQPATHDSVHVFTYRLVPRENSTSHFIDEYRLDAHSQPISNSAKNSDSPRSVGFGTLWLLFLPANLQESSFRYLGEQKIHGHQTYALAFAQIPGRVRQGTIVETAGGSCSTLIQGIVWIDQSTFRIIHLQTDLLWPLPGIHLNQLRSVLNYSEVKIPQRNLLLWLPSDVETTWQSGYNAGDELHRYSNYKLFAATSRILRPDEVPSH